MKKLCLILTISMYNYIYAQDDYKETYDYVKNEIAGLTKLEFQKWENSSKVFEVYPYQMTSRELNCYQYGRYEVLEELNCHLFGLHDYLQNRLDNKN